MALHTCDCEHAVQRPAAAVLDRVAEPVDRRRLTDDGTRRSARSWTAASRRRLAVPSIAAPSSSDVRSSCDRPLMLRRASHEAFGGGHQGRHRRLHVGRATSEEATVALDGRERVARPSLNGAGWDDVEMAGQADQRRAGSMPGPQILHRSPVDSLARESGPRQTRGDQLDGAGVIRRDRTAGDKALREVQGVRLDVADARRVTSVPRAAR